MVGLIPISKQGIQQIFGGGSFRIKYFCSQYFFADFVRWDATSYLGVWLGLFLLTGRVLFWIRTEAAKNSIAPMPTFWQKTCYASLRLCPFGCGAK